MVGDADRLVEVVENLVGNAIKYSPLPASAGPGQGACFTLSMPIAREP